MSVIAPNGGADLAAGALLVEAKQLLRRAQLVFGSVPNVRPETLRDLKRMLTMLRERLSVAQFARLNPGAVNDLLGTFDGLIVRARCLRPVPNNRDGDGEGLRELAGVQQTGRRGRPRRDDFDVHRAIELHLNGCKWTKIAETMEVSRRTLYNRLQGLPIDVRPKPAVQSTMTDDALDELIRHIKGDHDFVGSVIVRGHLRDLNLRVTLKHVRLSLARVDPVGNAQR